MSSNDAQASVEKKEKGVVAEGPRALAEVREFQTELHALRHNRLFWLGLGVKLVCAVLFGSHVATRWFAPFVYEFVHGGFNDPWAVFWANGEPAAFPYGPSMLGLLSLAWLPALFTSFDPGGPLGLFLLRLPLLFADLAILLMLMRWLKVHARDAVVTYWLSPIVFYATYIHGQLDLLPTALLCASLYGLFRKRVLLAAVLFGVALACKGHLLVSVPFAVVYLYRLRKPWRKFVVVMTLTTLGLYALPLRSQAFHEMVLHNAESAKLWSVVIPYGAHGPVLFVAPAFLAIAFLRFLGYRKVNQELTLMFVGAVYISVVALVPPQPGWYIWSIPFVAYLGTKFARTSKFALGAVSACYILYFFEVDPAAFLEAFDPVFGAGMGAQWALWLKSAAPGLFGAQATSLAWTALFSTTALTGFEMYRKGVRSNSLYALRDETFMIGIGGDSGAGKHTIARDLGGLLGTSITLINGDDDHRWERGHAMWKTYTHLDPRGNRLEAQFESLAALRRGGDVRKPHYDHDKGKFTNPILLQPSEFVGIVGLHPFYLASQRQLFHLKVFVEPLDEVRIQWKVARDVAKRGYTPEQVVAQIESRRADSEKYVQPQKRHADVVIRHMTVPQEDGKFSMEFDLSNELQPLALVDHLSLWPSLDVQWSADDALLRDTVGVSGYVTPTELAQLAEWAIPNVEELVAEGDSAWRNGSEGLTQLVLLYAISIRLKTGPAEGAMR